MAAAEGAMRWPEPARALDDGCHPSGVAGAAAPPPLVSVIVPAYGVGAFLGEALASLQAQ